MRALIPTLGLVIGLAWASPALAIDPVYTGFLSSSAVSGYDTVAYFTEGKPVEGVSEFQTEWQGVTWYFASRDNLERFQSAPERYAPQYGGYCAYAVAYGSTAPGDPQAWKIVDGKLYLNVSPSIQAEWEKDIPGYIRQANENWPTLLGQD